MKIRIGSKMKLRKLFVQCVVFFVLKSSLALANVLGTDTQTFNPTADGLSYVTVNSSQVLVPYTVNLGLFINGASNTLSFFENQSSQSLFNSRDRLYSADFNAAVGIWPGWQLSLSLPYLIKQENPGCDACVLFANPGFTETRASLKNGNYNFGVWGLAWILSFNQNRITNNPYSGASSGLTTNFELVFDRPIGQYQLSLNLGHRWRKIGDRITANNYISRVPNQAIYSLGLSYFKSNWDSNLIAELFGSKATESFPDGINLSDRNDQALEALVGIKHQVSHKLALHGGLGREVIKGFGTPDLRVYVGINYSFSYQSALVAVEKQFNAEVKKNEEIYVLENLTFKFDSINLIPASEELFDRVAEQVSKIPRIESLVVEGHTDSLGEAEYNLKLSQSRAEALKVRLEKYLKLKFINVPVKAIGFGESQPLAANTNFQGRARNRRVVIKAILQPDR